MTRRDFIRCGIGALVCKTAADAAPIRSALGMRNEEVIGGDGMPTAADYVQDGLVAMWDGIENAGWGEHDEDATEWTDLIGRWGVRITLTEYGMFDTNCLYVPYNANAPTGGGTKGTFGARPGMRFYRRSGVARGAYTHMECALKASYTSLPSSTIDLCSFENPDGIFINRSNFMTAYGLGNRQAKGVYFERGIPFTFSAFPKDIYYYNGVESTEGGDLYLGSSGQGIGTPKWVDSSFYCFRFYSRELTADEVAHNYEIDKIRFGFDEGVVEL